MSSNESEEKGLTPASENILEIKTELMKGVTKLVKRHHLTKRLVEKILNISQSTAGELISAKTNKLTIDELASYLVTMSIHVGEKVRVNVEIEKIA